MRRLFSCLILAVLALPRPATAEPTRLHYIGYAAGLRVLDMDVSLALGDEEYRGAVALHTLGVANVFSHAESLAQVSGAWRGVVAHPAQYGSDGVQHGDPHRMVITYRDGTPTVTARLPDDDDGREPVSAALQANTIDTMSAMAGLLRRVATTGRCEGTARVFDGRRLSDLAATTTGPETLEETGRSVFQGPTLRCDVTGTLLAGFKLSDDRARVARPQHGTVWLAALQPGAAPVPVRVSFHIGLLGDVTLYLVD